MRSKLFAFARLISRADWTNIKIALSLLWTGQFDRLRYGIRNYVFKQIGPALPDNENHFACLLNSNSYAGKTAWIDPVDIIIPVFNGKEFLVPLFQSIRKNTISSYRLIVIDDCSSDLDVAPLLRTQLEKFKDSVLLHNSQNVGFVGSVNRAAREAKNHFVILNTDTEVPPGWLERLMNPILSDPTIASTTPLTNAGAICSFPKFGADNQLFLGMTAVEIDASFSGMSLADPPVEIPSGVGFCMGFNSAVVSKIGLFDEIFGRGYAEENDWCMRARREGYRHILVNNLFVYHKHGGSFPSEEKIRLVKRNYRILKSRHPEYYKLVSLHARLDPARTIRKLAALLLSCKSASGRVLIIDHSLGGGANSYRRKIVADYVANDRAIMVFTNDPKFGKWRMDFEYKNQSFSLDIPDISWLDVLCSKAEISEIFYNDAASFADTPGVLAALLKIRAETGAKLITTFHDYYPVCPSYTLLNKDGRYCGVPDDLNECGKCLPNIPARFSAYIPKNTQINEWRDSWLQVLACSDEIRCFSENSKSIVTKAYPAIATKINVVPHALDWHAKSKPQLTRRSPIHIGIVGGINYAKGLDVITELVVNIRNSGKRIKVTVIGEIDSRKPIKGLKVTGRYKKDDLPGIIDKAGINIFLFPSVWPETFSYVTSELIAMEVPLVCFDVGAPAERVSQYAKGFVLPLDIDGPNLLDSIVAFHNRCYKEPS